MSRTSSCAGGPVRFRWPVPTTVRVTAAANVNGDTTIYAFYASLTREAPDRPLVVSMGRAEVLRVNGVDVTGREGRRRVVSMPSRSWTIPDFQVSDSGRFASAVHVDERIEEMIDDYWPSLRSHPGQLAAVAGMMRTQESRAFLASQADETWATWAGFWAGRNLTPGQRITVATHTTTRDGTKIPQTLTLEHRGRDPQRPDKAVLTADSVSEGKDDLAAAQSSVAFQAAFSSGDTGQLHLAAVHRRFHAEVVTDPCTAKPVEATRELLVDLTEQNGATEHVRIATRYTFDWELGHGAR